MSQILVQEIGFETSREFKEKVQIQENDINEYLDNSRSRIARINIDGTITIFELYCQRDKIIRRKVVEFKAHEGQITSFSWSFSKIENIIVTSGIDKNVLIWKEQALSWFIVQNVGLEDTYAINAKFKKNCPLLAVGYDNGLLKVCQYQEQTEKIIKSQIQSVFQAFYCLDWNKGQQFLITGGQINNQNMIKIFNILNENHIIFEQIFQYNVQEMINCIAFAPQIFNSEVQVSISYAKIIEILTFDFNKQFIQPFELIKKQKIELNICRRMLWSPIGDELKLFMIKECIYLQQNLENDYKIKKEQL